MAEDLAELTTEALVERAELHGIRRWLHESGWAVGCFTGLVAAGLLTWLGVHLLNWWWILLILPLALVIGITVIVNTGVALQAIAASGVARYVRELKRRHGLRDVERLAAEEIREPGLRYSVVATGTGLPSGRDHFVRIRFPASGPPALFARRSERAIEWVYGEDPREAIASEERTLTSEEAAPFEALIGFLEWGRKEVIAPRVKDGFPCRMVVIDHAAGARYTLRCNLAGAADKTTGVRLLRRTMSFGRQEWSAQTEPPLQLD